MVHEFWLQPASEAQLKMCPEHIYSASPCCGVFKSEKAFIKHLREYYAARYGDCIYHGIRGEKEYNPPLRISQVNYQIITSTPGVETKPASTLSVGTMAIIVSPESYSGHLVLPVGKPLLIVDLTEPDKVFTPDDANRILVRELLPGEEITFRGTGAITSA